MANPDRPRHCDDRLDDRLDDGSGDPGADPVVVWSTLRARRRATRWGRELDPHLAVTTEGLRVVDEATTLQAHWGGWA